MCREVRIHVIWMSGGAEFSSTLASVSPWPAGLQREGAEEAQLRARLAAVQLEEGKLPAEIDALQSTLQAELDALNALEASATTDPPSTDFKGMHGRPGRECFGKQIASLTCVMKGSYGSCSSFSRGWMILVSTLSGRGQH